MRVKRGHALLAAVLLAALAAFVYWGVLIPSGTWFQLYDRDQEQVVLSVPIQPGDQLQLEIEHSAEHFPWLEFYTVTDDLQFNLDAIAVGGYGAGVPAEMSVPTRIEDGLVWMEDINSLFPHFSWITSNRYMKGFSINGVEVFDFRSLPDASRIRGEIITTRGYLFRG
ncbi:MAG: DUF1850 domain-containing protein [Lawsonibacter sp.]|nr:DUF1850 domain-containing protein [Lawsonibacter sp.]